MDIFDGHANERELFYAEVTHKMKNILGGISGFSALLRKDIEEAGGDTSLIDRIVENVEKFDEWLVDTMTVVRDRKMHCESMDLPSMVREAAGAYYSEKVCADGLCPYPIESETSRLKVEADLLLFRRAVWHITRFLHRLPAEVFGCRIGHCEEGQVCMIWTFRADSHLQPLVHDQVRGINTVESLEARLSLAVAMKILAMHQGALQFRSTHPDSLELICRIP